MSEKAPKDRLLGAISSKITLTSPLTKETERRGKEERRRGEKAMVALLVFIMATLAEKNCWTQRVHLAVKFSKILLDDMFIPFLRKDQAHNGHK